MSTESLSPAFARRVALAAQGFGSPPQATVGTRQLNLFLRRLGVLQIDSVNVFERSHYLPALARLGAYDRSLLDRILAGPAMTEYWAHEAAFFPVTDLPLFDWRKAEYRDWYAARPDSFPNQNPEMLSWLRSELAEKGPLRASEVEHDSNVRRGPWWGWSDVKRGLETLFRTGEVVAAPRTRFERTYALPEQVLPREVLERSVPREEALRELVSTSIRALGIGTVSDVADYFRLKSADTVSALRDLEDAGSVRRVQVPGWGRDAYLHTEARLPRRIEAAALLSPFDPVVWERARALRLYDFHYRIEIYTPAPKRVYGYYTLPVLIDDRLPARIDLKSDRKAGVLRVQSAWAEPGFVDDDLPRIVGLLRQAAAWQGLERIEVADWGTLTSALRGALS